MANKTARNREIFYEKEAGETFLALSRKHGLSEKRVKDIYYREIKKLNLLPKRQRQ